MRSERRRNGRRCLGWCALAAAAWALPTRAGGQVTFLGAWGSAGTLNGQFEDPLGVAVGPDGSVYVSDAINNRVEIFTSTGVFASGFGSTGSASGKFQGASQIAVSAGETVYVTDFSNQRVDVFSSQGVPEGSFGIAGTAVGDFNGPDGVALNSNGQIYVTDTGNERVEIFSTLGAIQSAFGSSGTGAGQFTTPISAAVGQGGNVYVSDFGQSHVEEFSAGSVYESTIGGLGTGNGQFTSPNGIATDANGNLYVVDEGNDRVQVFNSAGVFQTAFGSLGTGPGQFRNPGTMAVAPSGFVYVTDQTDERVERFFAPGSWVSGVDNFTDPTVGPTNLGVGSGQILGTTLTLNSNMGLNAGTVNIQSGGTFNQNGGALSTASLTVSGFFNYAGGPLTVSGTPAITVNAGGVFAAEQGGSLPMGGAVNVSGFGAEMVLDGGVGLSSPTTITVGGGGVIDVGNAVVTSGAGGVVVSAGGEVELASAASSILEIPSASLSNSGLVRGSGRIVGQLVNNSLGQVNVNSGDDLTITGAGNVSAGQITLAGGSIEFNQSLNNQSGAQIIGDGTLRLDEGLTNNGFMALGGLASYLYGTVSNNAAAILGLSGSAYVFDNLTNAATGTVHLSGNTPNIIYGAFANSGALNVDAGAIGLLYGSYSGSGTILNNGSLFVQANSIAGPISGGGTLTLGEVGTPAGLQLLGLSALSTQGAVNINAGSTLDVSNDGLVLTYGSPAADPVVTIVQELHRGYNGGAWTGTGITSSSAAAGAGKFSVGYADGNADVGTAAGANQIFIEYTLAGDANLDGSVGFADLVAVAQNFGSIGKDWAHGNFTYDPAGSVGFADLVLVAQEFGQTTAVAAGEAEPVGLSPAWQAAGGTTQDFGELSRAVPEPGAVELALAGTAGLVGKRRRGRAIKDRFFWKFGKNKSK